MASGEVDVLFEVRNAFFLGNYQYCITEAQKIKVLLSQFTMVSNFADCLAHACTLMQRPSASEAVERDVLMYRAYIAQVGHKINNDTMI